MRRGIEENLKGGGEKGIGGSDRSSSGGWWGAAMILVTSCSNKIIERLRV